MPTIRLTWTDLNSGTTNEDEFRVYRATSPFDAGSLPAVFATVAADATSYDDETAIDGTTYYYAVSAVRGALEVVSDIISIGAGAAFPYDFPLLSIDSDTGVRTDWINSAATMAAQPGATGRWVLENGSTDRVFTFQEFAVGPDRHSVIDAGNAVIDLSHVIDTQEGDADGACAFAEFYDGSSVFLGKVFTTNQLTDTLITDSITGKRVPTGTRTIRIGWQAANHSGTELSAYVRDIACTIREETTVVWNSTVVLFSEREANLTGWTTTIGLFNTITADAADWEWASVQAYSGGNTAQTVAFKNFTFPTGWAAKVAAGDAGFILRCGAHNANKDDNVQVTVRLNNGSTNPTVTSGMLSLFFQMEFVELTGAIPSDTTSIDVILDFDRNDGTANDGAVDTLSILLYEIV